MNVAEIADKAVAGQTLTGLGKWWGRKPLVLVRAAILGLLLPASDNPAADRDVFLKLMTMDPDGMWRRCRAKGGLPAKVVYDYLPRNPQDEVFDTKDGKVRWKAPSTTVSSVYRYSDAADQRRHFVLVQGVPVWSPSTREVEKRRLARDAWLRQRVVREADRHVIRQTAPDCDVAAAVGARLQRDERHAADDAVVEPDREAQRRPGAGLRRWPVGLERMLRLIVDDVELPPLDHRRRINVRLYGVEPHAVV